MSSSHDEGQASLCFVQVQRKAVSKEELARHFRHWTRGTIDIERLLGELLHCVKTMSEWYKQRKHINCLQDPPDVHIYMVTRNIKKGGMMLPVLGCAEAPPLWRIFTSTWPSKIHVWAG